MDKVDVNKPLENPKLKKLLKQLHQQPYANKKMRKILDGIAEEIMFHAHFLSVVHLEKEPEHPADGKAFFPENTQVSFPLLSNKEGQDAYPVFTDWEELSKWKELGGIPPKTFILDFEEYVSMVTGHPDTVGFIINPFGNDFLVDRERMERWSVIKRMREKNYSVAVYDKQPAVYYGEVENPPKELITSLTRCAKRDKRIYAIWLRRMERGEEHGLLAVVDFIGNQDQVFTELKEAAKVYTGSPALQFVSHAEDQRRVGGDKPFYKQKPGFFDV